jgi:tetratricopeptide (TPR) repeat protein
LIRFTFILSLLIRFTADTFAHEGLQETAAEAAKNPLNAGLQVKLAQMHLADHGDWQSCLVALERASRIDPTLPLDSIQGEALAKAGKTTEAMSLFQSHLSTHAGDAGIRAKLARLQAKVGDLSAASSSYKLVLEHTTRPEPDLRWEAAQLLSRMNQLADALAILDAAEPTPILAEQAAQLAAQHQQWDEALRRMDALIDSQTFKEPWLAKRATLLGQAQRNDEALAAWHQLSQRIAAMPPRQRGSNAMTQLSAKCRDAFQRLSASR